MRCKPGDLAVIVGGDAAELIGRIVVVTRLRADPNWPPDFGPHWVTMPVLTRFGRICLIADETLRPIRGDDGRDETLGWAGFPGDRFGTFTIDSAIGRPAKIERRSSLALEGT